MLRALLVDDEENALDMLTILLDEIGNVTVVGKYIDILQALEHIEHAEPDVVFLDIEMPGMNGLEAARAIKEIRPATQIVFATAHSNYAVEAFDIQSADYLLKPYTLERLGRSLMRIEPLPRTGVTSRGVQSTVCCMGNFYIGPVNQPDNRVRWRTNKEKELCAFLIHHEGQIVDHEVIMEALWPDSEHSVKAYLYACVSLLRKQLRTSNVHATVNKVGNGYMITTAELSVDAAELEQVLDDAINSKQLSAEPVYNRIVSLYKGEYLAGCDYIWAGARRAKLTSKYIKALRKLFTEFQAVHSQLAVDCLVRIMAVMPESEQDGRELIKWHLKAGERAEAVGVYRRLDQAVAVQLGVQLEEETVRLYKELIAREQVKHEEA